jgi:hypothetical protein
MGELDGTVSLGAFDPGRAVTSDVEQRGAGAVIRRREVQVVPWT